MAETNLRQAEAKIFATGIVSEMDLKEVVEDGRTKIKGSLTVKTSDVNFIKYNVNVAEKTNSGTDNKAYPGIKTVMETYKSIAEVGEEEADRVRVSGDINPYRSNNTKEEVINYKSNFFSRITTDDYEPKAEFTMEMFIEAIIPEMNSDGETGRILVKGWLPTYNGIEPVVLIADNDTEDQIASAIESTFEPGQTVKFFGDAVNNRVVKTINIPVAIGKPKQQIKTTYKNELVITGATEAYEDGVSPEKPYDAETIKAAIRVREERIAEEDAKAKAGNSRSTGTQRPSGASKGRTMSW